MDKIHCILNKLSTSKTWEEQDRLYLFFNTTSIINSSNIIIITTAMHLCHWLPKVRVYSKVSAFEKAICPHHCCPVHANEVMLGSCIPKLINS